MLATTLATSDSDDTAAGAAAAGAEQAQRAQGIRQDGSDALAAQRDREARYAAAACRARMAQRT